MTGEAIILVGGRGTRLGPLTEHTPKPLLPVAGRPFLFHLFDYLLEQGVRHAVLATGYLANEFAGLGQHYRELRLSQAPEPVPLGTGGALVHGLPHTDENDIFVLNGDTYFPADLGALFATHVRHQAALSLVLREVPNAARYGAVLTDGELVTSLREKGATGPGLINGGTYLIRRSALLTDAPGEVFSLERDLLPRWIDRRAVACIRSSAYFIDIGIPADLVAAQRTLGAPAR